MKFSLFTVAAISMAPFMADAQVRGGVERQLSYEAIAGYEPRHKMTDHAAIDLDQSAINNLIGDQTPESFAAAKKVYQEGGNSKSYALLTLTTAPPGTEVTKEKKLTVGDIKGEVLSTAKSVDKQIKFKYPTSEISGDHVDCKVGGLPADLQKKDGCLPATGQVQIEGVTDPIDYTYSIDTENKNGRTLQGFSLQAEEKMYKCSVGCPYASFVKYYNYYGKFNYADRWVTAAFDGGIAEFGGFVGNVDFGKYGLVGRGECAKKGTAYMNNFMYVIREFEDAIDDCKVSCETCNLDRVNAWDEGVAFYAGSLAGTAYNSEQDKGVMLRRLADKRCANFNTCGPEGNKPSGYAKVNYDLFNLFALGQTELVQKTCEEANKTKEKVIQKMQIPLVQGTLRYAYKVEKQGGGEKEKAEGAVFAASILPFVHACSKTDAKTILDSMGVGATKTSFADVKAAFERNYKCMGITCADVGELMNAGLPFPGAEKCTDASTTSSSSKNNALAIGLGVTAGVVGLVAVFTICYMVKREKSGNPVFAGEKGSLS